VVEFYITALAVVVFREIVYGTVKEAMAPTSPFFFIIIIITLSFSLIYLMSIEGFLHCSLLLGYRGSLLTRNLADLVKKEHFILDSEYLTTLLVIVPK
jgi:hypothetical protein